MAGIKGPAVFLAQFLRDTPPFNTLENICKWFAELGYAGVQIPGWDRRVIDIDLGRNLGRLLRRAERKARRTWALRHRDRRLSGGPGAGDPSRLRGRLRRVPSARADAARRAPSGRPAEVRKCIDASAKLGLRNMPVLSGGFAWHMIYPWPQRPPGLIDEAFKELARRWRPLLDFAHDHGCVFGYELHPGSDIYDGATFEMFLDHTDQPSGRLHQLRSEPFPPAAARLLRVHRALRQADQRLSRQGRRVPAERPRRRLRRLSAVGQASRPLPFARRRPGRFQARVHAADRGRLRRLGRAGMGVLREEPRAGRARGRAVHPPAPHRADDRRVRRFRRRRAAMPKQTARCWDWPEGDASWRAGNASCAWEWSAAGRAPSSAAFTVSPPRSISRSNSSPAVSRSHTRTPSDRRAALSRSGPLLSAPTRTWRRRKRSCLPTSGSISSASSRPTSRISRSPRHSSRPAFTSSATSR